MAIRKTKEQSTVSNAVSEIFDISEKIHGYLEDIRTGLVSAIVQSVFCIFLFCLLIGIIYFQIRIPSADFCMPLLVGIFIFILAILGFYSGIKSFNHYMNFYWKLDTIVKFRKFDSSPKLPEGETAIDRMVNYLRINDGRVAEAINIMDKKPKRKKDMIMNALSGKSGKDYSYGYILNGVEDYFVIDVINRRASEKDVIKFKKEIEDITPMSKSPPSRIILVQQGDDIDEKVLEFIHNKWIVYEVRDKNWPVKSRFEVPIEVISETKSGNYLFGLLYFY